MNVSAILLAAGKGTRMLSDIPKPLSPILGEPLLQRTLRQLHEIGVPDIVIVTGFQAEAIRNAALASYPSVRFWHNERYAEDRNIGSLLGGMQTIPHENAVLVLEADVALTSFGATLLQQKIMTQTSTAPRSFWTACGTFRPDHGMGGILRANNTGQLQEIRYSPYANNLECWLKNLGIIFVAPQQRVLYTKLLHEYAEKNIDQYFLTPWAEHIIDLPADVVDLSDKGGLSFNTPVEYQRAELLLRAAEGPSINMPFSVHLLETHKLRHIEGYNQERSQWLADKIQKDAFWTTPLAVSEGDFLVMDGQHRMEAARILGLSKVPVVYFSYDDVSIFSLRPEKFQVSVSEIRQRVVSKNIYPYKTVKHILPMLEQTCATPLQDLL